MMAYGLAQNLTQTFIENKLLRLRKQSKHLCAMLKLQSHGLIISVSVLFLLYIPKSDFKVQLLFRYTSEMFYANTRHSIFIIAFS